MQASEGGWQHLTKLHEWAVEAEKQKSCSQTALEWIALLERARKRKEKGEEKKGKHTKQAKESELRQCEALSWLKVVGKVSFMHLIAPNAVKD